MTTTTINTDTFASSGDPAYKFTDSSETLLVGSDVVVYAASAPCIWSDYLSNTLINYGRVLSGVDGGVFWSADAAVYNTPYGVISGVAAGISSFGSGTFVVNQGAITATGLSGTGVTLLGDHFLLRNMGYVSANKSIYLFGSDGQVVNGGLISGSTGIFVDHDVASPIDTIINEVGGIIAGTTSSVHSIRGAVSVANSGLVAGSIYLTAPGADDRIFNKATINGNVWLGPGNDVYNGGGGTLNGVIHGGAGSDRLIAGPGKDVFYGDAGADRFVFASRLTTPVGTSRDKIMDFSHGQQDKIVLSAIDADTTVAGNQSFHFIGNKAFGHHPGELHYVVKSGFVIVEGDVNGNGKADFQIEVDNLANNLASLAAADFVL